MRDTKAISLFTEYLKGIHTRVKQLFVITLNRLHKVLKVYISADIKGLHIQSILML